MGVRVSGLKGGWQVLNFGVRKTGWPYWLGR